AAPGRPPGGDQFSLARGPYGQAMPGGCGAARPGAGATADPGKGHAAAFRAGVGTGPARRGRGARECPRALGRAACGAAYRRGAECGACRRAGQYGCAGRWTRFLPGGEGPLMVRLVVVFAVLLMLSAISLVTA